ncbi:MAG: glycoside hydrolase family 127 protein [Planctomycetaceae bacterium]
MPAVTSPGRPLAAVLVVLSLAPAAAAPPAPRRGLAEVDHGRVTVTGGFWGPRLARLHEVTIPHALDELEKDGHVTNFDKAAGTFSGPLRGHRAFDSDLHKALEGAYASLRHRPDAPLRARCDGIVDRILAAQRPDGFLISHFIVADFETRWEDLRLEHQLYNAGHFFEMAVVHRDTTGRPEVLEAARRFADDVDRTFGEGKRYDVDGHPEVELALVRLWRATGEDRYLALARFFVDERGHAHGSARQPFDPASVRQPEPPPEPVSDEARRTYRRAKLRVRNGQMQDHRPLVEQDAAVGHAVRAGYLYAAAADLARFMDAPQYARAGRRLWEDVVGRKMYVTGGIGTAQYHDEGFGDPYLLPNDTAYTESCAAIAHVLWQHRLALLDADAACADVMELALYNGLLSGIALDGARFFYQNPLESRAGGRRRPWIGLSCCPTNLARILPQVGGLAYAVGDRALHVNLFVAGSAAVDVPGAGPVTLAVETDYPWQGRVRITVAPQAPAEFDLALRIPGWARGRPVPSDLYRFVEADVPPVALAVAGAAVAAEPTADGYVHLRRRWQPGEVVELELPLPVRRVRAHPRVEHDRGKVALMRGPLVYCLEAVDHPGTDPFACELPATVEFAAEHRADLLGGVTVVRTTALAAGAPVPLTAVPYHAWANREQGAMLVWIRAAADD